MSPTIPSNLFVLRLSFPHAALSTKGPLSSFAFLTEKSSRNATGSFSAKRTSGFRASLIWIWVATVRFGNYDTNTPELTGATQKYLNWTSSTTMTLQPLLGSSPFAFRSILVKRVPTTQPSQSRVTFGNRGLGQTPNAS